MSNVWTVTTARGQDEILTGALQSWYGLYSRSARSGICPNNLVDAVLTEAFRQLFERGAVGHLATNPADASHWLGFLVTERTRDDVPVVHCAFTKPIYRRSGVQRTLFAAAGIERTGRLFYTAAVGPEHKFLPAGRFAPEIARRVKA